ncbi:MAG: SpoIIE family protein phosphatase, partial [Armatimonadota bacterium]|nr:SpoIIE family protein phosphatase [Armatimonadota bacterium]
QELLTGIIYLLVVLAGLTMIQWRTTSLIQSIRRLQRAAQAMAGGDIGYRLKVTAETEMDALAVAFNDMAGRLETHQDLLHDRNKQLNALLRLLEGLRTEREPTELLRRITMDAAHVTAANIAFLALVMEDDIRLTEWWNGQRWTKIDLRWPQGEGVAGWVWLNHDTRSSDNYATDPYATPEMALALDLKNYVCAPIVLPNTTVAGVLFVGNKAQKGAFKEDDVRIMEILARHAGVAMEVEAAFMRERRIGATLQKAMLPDVDPHLGGLSIAREYRAAADEAELGGDFYDVIELGPDRIGLVIADVSGKGLRAAVQTAAVKYALRAYAMEDPEPASVLRRLNRCCSVGPRNRGFTTLFYGVIDLRLWEMNYANAGHQPPLLRRANGKVETLSARGVVLGVADNNMVSFPTQTVMLGAGDTLVLYTDGLSEARHGDDFLDTEGVQALLGDMNVSAHDTARLLLEEATAFSEGALRDDVALLVVKTPIPLPISAETPNIISYRQ